METGKKKHTNLLKLEAKPLTLKEVLRLRDGLGAQKDPKPRYPYQKQKLANNDKILLALN